jgi:beta-N-acetylhexosaminidase
MNIKIALSTFLLFIIFFGCSKNVVKKTFVDVEQPREPIIVKIVKTEKEKKSEKLKNLVSEIVEKLPLSIKIGQMITSYPPHYDSVKKYQIGGVILNQNFIKDTLSVKKMINKYNRMALIPLFFAIDQEGGKVNRLKNIYGYEQTPSAMKLGSSYPESQLFEYAYTTGTTMRKLGINTNLAPSLDLSGSEKSLMFKQGRSLGSDPHTVLRKAEMLIHGYRAGGVLVFAKHYPGYRDVEINSDVSVASFHSQPVVMVENFTLFATLAGKIDGVMMSSVIYSDFDDVPALFSKKIINLIRISNPDILVMTDDLFAPSLRILEEENLSMISTKAFIAGNDILLILWDIKVPIIIEAIKNTVDENPKLKKSVNRSVTRILLAKERVYPGLIEELYKDWVED